MRAVSGQLGRDLVQSELDLFHYARVCARCGGGGANQVARVAKKFRVRGSAGIYIRAISGGFFCPK